MDKEIYGFWKKKAEKEEVWMVPSRRLAFHHNKLYFVSRDKMNEEYERNGKYGEPSTIVFLCRKEKEFFKVHAIPMVYLSEMEEDGLKYYSIDRPEKMVFIDNVKLSKSKTEKKFYDKYEKFTYNEIIRRYGS